MSPEAHEFVRDLGCLKIHIQHLETRLRKNDLSGIETEAGEVESTLIQLLRAQRALPRNEQQQMRGRFVTLRQDALRVLEISRRILDESLRATVELLDIIEASNDYEGRKSGRSIMIDRKA
ncbi:hypothetical protein KJZ99_03615 [bacterium]|nr:hypothetical protein [bacterium]